MPSDLYFSGLYRFPEEAHVSNDLHIAATIQQDDTM